MRGMLAKVMTPGFAGGHDLTYQMFILLLISLLYIVDIGCIPKRNRIFPVVSSSVSHTMGNNAVLSF